MHKLDIKCFGIKYKKKVRVQPEKWANTNTKDLAEYVKAQKN